VKAFKHCGIVPYNRGIFTDEDFLPSTVTDQTHLIRAELEVGVLPLDDAESSEKNDDIQESSNLNETSAEIPPIVPPEIGLREIEAEEVPPVVSSILNPPEIEAEDAEIGVAEIYPKPRIKRARARQGKKGSSLLLTSTPEKDKLAAKIEEKKKIEDEKAKKRKLRAEKKIQKDLEVEMKKKKQNERAASRGKNERAASRGKIKSAVTPKPSTSRRLDYDADAATRCPACEEIYVHPPVRS
jgi:hypothetical protein